MSYREQASFIVRTPSGALTFVLWPAPEEANVQRYRGVPRGTVAIAHTHPNGLPLRSAIDRGTAMSTHVPVYVVTKTKITLTDGRKTRVVVDGEWSPASVLEKCSMEFLPLRTAFPTLAAPVFGPRTIL
jgi:hypothetical protein